MESAHADVVMALRQLTEPNRRQLRRPEHHSRCKGRSPPIIVCVQDAGHREEAVDVGYGAEEPPKLPNMLTVS